MFKYTFEPVDEKAEFFVEEWSETSNYGKVLVMNKEGEVIGFGKVKKLVQ